MRTTAKPMEGGSWNGRILPPIGRVGEGGLASPHSFELHYFDPQSIALQIQIQLHQGLAVQAGKYTLAVFLEMPPLGLS